jgi:hypothetical protein
MCSRTGTRHGIKWRDMLAQAVHLREGEHGNRPILIVFLYHSISVSLITTKQEVVRDG